MLYAGYLVSTRGVCAVYRNYVQVQRSREPVPQTVICCGVACACVMLVAAHGKAVDEARGSYIVSQKLSCALHSDSACLTVDRVPVGKCRVVCALTLRYNGDYDGLIADVIIWDVVSRVMRGWPCDLTVWVVSVVVCIKESAHEQVYILS